MGPLKHSQTTDWYHLSSVSWGSYFIAVEFIKQLLSFAYFSFCSPITGTITLQVDWQSFWSSCADVIKSLFYNHYIISQYPHKSWLMTAAGVRTGLCWHLKWASRVKRQLNNVSQFYWHMTLILSSIYLLQT